MIPGVFRTAVFGILLHLPSVLAAQSPWVLDLSAGYVSYDAVTAQVGTGSLIAGVRRGTGQPSWLYLYGGSPLEAQGVFWAAAGTGGRLAASRGVLSLGTDLGLHLVGYRDAAAEVAGGGATLEALPLLALRQGRLGVELRSGLQQHTDLYDGDRTTRRLHATTAQLGFSPVPALQLLVETRYLRAPEDDYPFLGAAVEVAQGRATLWASAGRWLTDTIPTPSYGLGAGWRLGDRWELQAAWQQEANHPLYWNLPRRTWSVRISRSLGRHPAGRQPQTSVVPRDAQGRITLRIPAAEATAAPSVLGEFNGWLPQPMVREGAFWTARLAVEPGVYRYGFQDANGQWFLPPSVIHTVDDGMGGTSGVLIVP